MQTCRILLLAAIVSFFSGCSDRKNDLRFPAAPSDPGSIVVTVGSISIGSELVRVEYGTLTVPESRVASSSRLISIPFIRLHSPSTSPMEPVFAFAGGPGQSNVTWDWGKAEIFLTEHDFVVVGYRGVDGSSVLDCPGVTEELKRTDEPLSEASLKRIGEAWSRDADRLRSRGVDLDGYTMLECIEDNECICDRLGYSRINLLSESYGTRIAYLYALKHPDRIFRSAMIGVNPPGHFVWDAKMVDEQLKQYAALWRRDSAVATRCPDLYEALRTVLLSPPRRWLFVPIDPDKVKVVTFALLYHRNTAAMAFDAYVAAWKGDPSGLALMSLSYDYVVPTIGSWGDLASKAVSADFDSTRNYVADENPENYPLGSPMSRLLWGSLAYCRWPIGLMPEEFRTLRTSEVSTLLLSGSVDFSTPPEYATRELLPRLPYGRQIILSECGHVNDVWNVDRENTDLLLRSFFDSGIPNSSLNGYVPMSFAVSWGLPTIAKMVLLVLAMLLAGVVAAGWWLLRRVQRKKAVVAPGSEG